MSSRKRVALAATASAALGAIALAATSFGGADGGGGSAYPEAKAVEVHRVDAPSAGASAAAIASGAARKPEIKYFEAADPLPVLAGNTLAAEVRCPRRHRVLTGYYFTTDASTGQAGTRTFLGSTFPDPRRKWVVGVTNTAGVGTAQVIFGIVCAKGVE
jgi:hypothetical protein